MYHTALIFNRHRLLIISIGWLNIILVDNEVIQQQELLGNERNKRSYYIYVWRTYVIFVQGISICEKKEIALLCWHKKKIKIIIKGNWQQKKNNLNTLYWWIQFKGQTMKVNGCWIVQTTALGPLIRDKWKEN